jgi:hypothetical protein
MDKIPFYIFIFLQSNVLSTQSAVVIFSSKVDSYSTNSSTLKIILQCHKYVFKIFKDRGQFLAAHFENNCRKFLTQV